jgi:FdrA protein
MKEIRLHKNRYVDSVTLMSVGDHALELDGVENAEAQMATPANVEMLSGLGYAVPEDAGADDLIFAVTADCPESVQRAFQRMEDVLLHRLPSEEEAVCRSLDEIDFSQDPYDLAQISLPGEYVFPQAEKALEKGLSLFIFSDGVPLAEERALKEKGIAAGHLVMGPDCGVAFVNGVCLGAGSILKSGCVGIAAASGSGAQEIACLLERCGLGISQLIGTGGRDLLPEIGGLSMLDGIERLERDADTKAIVLVSKLADAGVMEKVLRRADSVKKTGHCRVPRRRTVPFCRTSRNAGRLAGRSSSPDCRRGWRKAAGIPSFGGKNRSVGGKRDQAVSSRTALFPRPLLRRNVHGGSAYLLFEALPGRGAAFQP